MSEELPIFKPRYPLAEDCFEGVKKHVIRNEKQAASVYLAYIALAEYVPVIEYRAQEGYATLTCIVDDEAKALVDEYRRLLNEVARRFIETIHLQDFSKALDNDDLQMARKLLNDIEESLKSLGLPQYASAFRALNEAAIAALKRHDERKVSEAVSKAVDVISKAEYEYVMRELSKKYMILLAGGFAIILLKPPAPGLHSIPTDFIPLMEELARLFPDDVKVHKNPDDEDAAFADAIRRLKNKDYVRRIIDAYLERNGITLLNAPGAYLLAWLAPINAISAMKTIKNGYLTAIDAVGDDIYIIEYPKVKLESSGDKTKDFEEIMKTAQT